jgi:uncharacterized metal-binding protein
MYLACLALLVATLLKPLGVPAPAWLWAQSQQLWRQHRSLLIAALVGVEASSWLHLLQDGDPMPRLPRILRRKRRRRQKRRARRR